MQEILASPSSKQKQAAQLFAMLCAEERLAWLNGAKTFKELFGCVLDRTVHEELVELIFAWELDRSR